MHAMMPKRDKAREPERLFMMAVMQLAKLSGWLCMEGY